MSVASFPPAMRKLVNEFTKLPSIGEKSAVRLAYHLLLKDPEDSRLLAEAIKEAREKTGFCSNCFSMCEAERCSICSNPSRDQSLVCVVEKPADVLVIERSRSFHGTYHVLHGLWSPLRGISPQQTKIIDLIKRIESSAGAIKEVVLATGATVEGDATALYIARALKELGVVTSRIAQGLPKGGELEYADEVTLSHALKGRQVIL